MPDLISREALLSRIDPDEYYHSNEVKDMLQDCPAVDAVPVVRCKECRHAKESKDAFDWDGITPLCECSYMTQPNRWHEYCSWGERRNDNAAD